ncbi:unnamed protein product [Schistosoma margrebowiei]|uniref:Uncharacterized protein n=1 Tax=Schistosoma margrebowiei TaxID=48269 RepID=A0A183MAN6_9TREM|nr:unnamed protein product [Schistosoma margrebowiei]
MGYSFWTTEVIIIMNLNHSKLYLHFYYLLSFQVFGINW